MHKNRFFAYITARPIWSSVSAALGQGNKMGTILAGALDAMNSEYATHGGSSG